MRKFLKPMLAAYVILLCSLMGGCSTSPAYVVATRVTQDKNEFFRSFPELTERENILKIAEETGESLGYKSIGAISTVYFNGLGLKVSTDNEVKKILLPGGTTTRIRISCPKPSALAEFKKNVVRESIGEQDYQKMTTLCIYLEHKGYWGAGGKEEAERIFNEFIDKFLERARVEKKNRSS
jgi:hypothetical protein